MHDWIFIFLSAAWIGEFLLFRSRKGDKSEEDTGSFPWIMAAVLAVVIVSVLSREMALFTMPLAGILYSGLAVYAAGIALRYAGSAALGRQFTRDVNVSSSDTIVSSGPFRLLRHPLYTGLLLITFGFALYMTSLLGLAAAVFGVLPALLRRIELEERMLTQAFGEDYQTWMKKRYRLIPFLY
ncbi:methyltransferase family protein [Alkalicoccus chagannorensis]|uniref:methyltransferase family protein n=1 Tax=Alkalicoccus chagannorensis TaxID=427072 RepID=UPI001477044B|nr:isoprenylcysteine carboxylmethyltransferase family protein [Alkalicoccus chagannorensis]